MATLTYTLIRDCLNNVEDPGVRWQIEGGKVLEIHDFNSGSEIGSVSAASSAFSAHIGKQFKRVVNTLTIG